MASARNQWILLASAAVALVGSWNATESCAQDYFKYPPYGAWRGRMVHRDGLLHSERYRWGGGLTATGGAVLTTAITNVVPMIPTLVGGREFESDTRDTRSREEKMRSILGDEYAEQQRRANELLVRTAALVGNQPVKTEVTQPADNKQTPDLDTLLKRYPNNPWSNNKETINE